MLLNPSTFGSGALPLTSNPPVRVRALKASTEVRRSLSMIRSAKSPSLSDWKPVTWVKGG